MIVDNVAPQTSSSMPIGNSASLEQSPVWSSLLGRSWRFRLCIFLGEVLTPKLSANLPQAPMAWKVKTTSPACQLARRKSAMCWHNPLVPHTVPPLSLPDDKRFPAPRYAVGPLLGLLKPSLSAQTLRGVSLHDSPGDLSEKLSKGVQGLKRWIPYLEDRMDTRWSQKRAT
jgi:hypothetical protein